MDRTAHKSAGMALTACGFNTHSRVRDALAGSNLASDLWAVRSKIALSTTPHRLVGLEVPSLLCTDTSVTSIANSRMEGTMPTAVLQRHCREITGRPT